MTDYFVGPGGNDGDDGLSWVNRKLTLNGAEDVPVVASDNVFVGPGVYRELLTLDVSGGAGDIITYIGDVTGENTDGVGGIVRITGSDDDQTLVRSQCIFASEIDYRTFRGFRYDLADTYAIQGDDCEHWIVEDCALAENDDRGIWWRFGGTDLTVRRCIFWGHGEEHILIQDGPDDGLHLMENCIFLDCGAFNAAIASDAVGGITVRNCHALGSTWGVRVTGALGGGATPIAVENSVFLGCRVAMEAIILGEIVEDFNTFWNNNTNRTNVSIGADSQIYPPLLLNPILQSGVSQVSGFKFPWWFGELSEWSQVQAITGSNEPTEDLRGVARPATAAKNSWGPLQFVDTERDTSTVRTGTASIVFHDAGRHQIFVPITNSSTTISVFVNREADYAGTNPQLVIKQPGQADDTTVDIGAAGAWNKLTTTLTPAASPPYVIAELVSNNTAVAGSFATYFDDLTVD